MVHILDVTPVKITRRTPGEARRADVAHPTAHSESDPVTRGTLGGQASMFRSLDRMYYVHLLQTSRLLPHRFITASSRPPANSPLKRPVPASP